MIKQDTKKSIMDAAITLFAQEGYEAVSVAKIAAAVNIKAPSLYKHYEGKQCIFEAIVKEMDTRYEKQVQPMNFDGKDAQKDQDVFLHINEQQLIDMAKQLFLFFLHDDYTCKFRKLLTIEQFHNSTLAKQYTKLYVHDPLTYQSTLFAQFVKSGTFVEADSQVIATHFYAPMYMYITLCDRDATYESTALQMIEAHIKQFSKLYSNH